MTVEDVRLVTQRRAAGLRLWYGDAVHPGDILPMIIVKVWDNGSVNGQVFLDGDDTCWVTSVTLGEGPGHFAWPPSP